MLDAKLLNSFLEGCPPKKIRMLAAGGLVPLPPSELLRLLVRLAADPDQDVAQKALATLGGWHEKEIIPQLKSAECSPEVLDHFTSSQAEEVHEAIILNPQATGAIIAKLAVRVSESLLETILYNRTRLLNSPEILQGVKANPAVTARLLGQVHEIEIEYFGTKSRDYTAPESDAETPLPAETGELEAELAPDDLILEGLPVDPQEREAAIFSRISAMTVRQKIQLALMGTREARTILIRDANKEVSHSVLQSPKLTVIEVEGFTAMRSIPEDILRQIGNNKAWTRSYVVLHNLVRNPKTPPMISQRLLPRLHQRDLTMMAKDRGIPEAVRRCVERLLSQHKSQRSMG